MTSSSKIITSDKKINTPSIIIVIMLILTALTGILNQTILSLGIVLCCAVLLLCGKIYLAFPFMLFYTSFYGLLFGISVFRLYTLMVIASVFLYGKFSINKKHLAPLAVCTLYICGVLVPAIGITSSVFLLIDILSGLLVINQLLNKTDSSLKSFFKIYTLVAFESFFTGIVRSNSLGDEYNYSRFMATFEDPNYMGFFFTIAIFAIIALKLFDKRIRVILVIALYAMILTALSVTAIVVNALLWMIYLVVTERIKFKVALIVAIVLISIVSIYNYALAHPSLPVLGSFAERINEKLLSLESGDISGVTTGRSNLSLAHLEYYMDSSVFNILFGGIPASARYIHPDLSGAAHNDYVDMLLNVGFVGAAIMFIYFFGEVFSHIKKYRQSKHSKYLAIIMCKSVWACYALALTMFLDYRFMFIFFI